MTNCQSALKAEPSAILQAILEIPELGNLLFSYLSVSDLSRAERVSKCFRNNIFLNHSREIAFFRELSETIQGRVKRRIESDSDYLIDYLERFSKTKPEGYFRAMQHRRPKDFVEIMYFNLREISGQCPSFDTEQKTVMIHENRVHTVQSSADIPVILSASDAEVKIVELIHGTQWVETLSTPYDISRWPEYSAQLIANGTGLVTNNSHLVKIFERSRDGQWEHKASLFDNNETARSCQEHVSPDSCNVFVTAMCDDDDGVQTFSTKYCGKNSGGEWIKSTIGETDWVLVLDVTGDGRCALVRDEDDLLVYEQTEAGPVVSKVCDCHGSARFSPDGTHVVSNYGGNGAKVYIRSNQGDWREKHAIDPEASRYSYLKVMYSPDGTTIALNDSFRIEIFGQQGKAWGRQAVLDDFGGFRTYSEFIFSPDGTHGVVTLASGNVINGEQRIVGKISNGSWVEKEKVAAHGLIVFSPDQTHVAVYTGRDQRVTLCELSDDEALPAVAIIEQSQTVHSIQFSTEGSFLVTGSDDGVVRIWGQSGNRRWTERDTIAHNGPVHLVKFVMEMTHVLVCCDNRAILYKLNPKGLSFSV